MPINDWQKLLSAHFLELSQKRKQASKVLFALEHGLNSSQISALKVDLLDSISRPASADACWLTWVVYAAELGYDFDGDEYWPSFERRTPGWREAHGDGRNWLRERFKRFSRVYNGAQPAGPWAENFSIIAWPIRHAILPRDLQYHLAKLLYELRFDITDALLSNPERLGQFIHTNSWNSSRRLIAFSEDYEIVGQIASALLLRERCREGEVILPSTLARLIEDLEKERQAKDWLAAAQRQVEVHRTTSTGIAGGIKQGGTLPGTVREEPTKPTLRPSFCFMQGPGEVWTAFLEIPGIAPLVADDPTLRKIVAGSQCAIQGSKAKLHARGWLLHCPQRVALSAWPNHEKPLVQLHPHDEIVNRTLATVLRRRQPGLGLFRIGRDGIAREVIGTDVRPGRQYLLVAPRSLQATHGMARPAKTSCAGIQVWRLECPADWSATDVAFLEAVGLTPFRTMDIEPVGLPPISWDGETFLESYVHAPALIAVKPDFDVARIRIAVNASEQFSATATGTSPIFFRVPVLPVGDHEISVSVTSADASAVEQSATLALRVAPLSPRLAGLKRILRISCEPESATLGQLISGAAYLEGSGPTGWPVAVRLELYARAGQGPLTSRSMGTLTLPITPDSWRDAFRKNIAGATEVLESLDDANKGIVILEAGELGTTRLEFEHDLKPLRWKLNRAAGRPNVRLVYEGENPQALTVDSYSFESPDNKKSLSGGLFEQGRAVAMHQGLLIARSTDHSSSIVTPRLPNGNGLQALALNINLQNLPRTTESIATFCEVHGLWRDAACSNSPLALLARNYVLHRLTAEICARTCGLPSSQSNTGTGEQEIYSGFLAREGLYTMARQVDAVLRSSPFENRVAALAEKLISITPMSLVSIPTRVAEPQNWLAELLLRLASDPGTIGRFSPASALESIGAVKRQPKLLVLARWCVLKSEEWGQDVPLSVRPAYKHWRWPL